MELSSPKIKKFRRKIFELKKNLFYFRKWNFLALSLKNSYAFSKKILLFQKRNLQSLEIKMLYVSSNGTL